jgi:hypothetical protein
VTEADGSTDIGRRHPNVYLSPSERRVLRVRRHWAYLLPVMTETVVIVNATFYLSRLLAGIVSMWLVQSLLWYVTAGVVLHFAWRILEWWNEIIIVTDKRLMLNNGINARKNAFMPIRKVTDMSFHRSVVGRLLGYGTLRVESDGQKHDLEILKYLPKPDEVFPAISDLALLKSVREHASADPVEREHDIFLSHATADLALARALYHALRGLGADVWIDDFSLKLGQNIVRAIDRGISGSRIGVVLVTPTVIAGRPWMEKELSALLNDKETVIPILHEVTLAQLQEYSPLLHLKKGLSTADRSVDDIARLIVSTLDEPE